METTVSYKCPNCDAGLVFDPGKGKFTCEFCLSEFTKEELDKTSSAKKAEEAANADSAFSDGVNEYRCPSCGAEVIADKETAADICYYCHNPIVLADKVSGGHRPSKIIPFKFDKEEAKKTFLRYAKKKWFVPRDYFSEEHSDKIAGVYYPFWVTDADTDADFQAVGTRSRSWRQGDYMYTETSRYAVRRAGEIHFEDITTAAISTEDKRMLEGILPYPSDAHVPFDMPYLLGYVAKKRNVEREDLTSEVRGRMENYAGTLLSREVHGYGSVYDKHTDVQVRMSHWEYTLFPIWILTYERRGKVYTYAMNGHTGKIYGELPVSMKKLLLFAGALAVLLTGIFTLFGGFVL